MALIHTNSVDLRFNLNDYARAVIARGSCRLAAFGGGDQRRVRPRRIFDAAARAVSFESSRCSRVFSHRSSSTISLSASIRVSSSSVEIRSIAWGRKSDSGVEERDCARPGSVAICATPAIKSTAIAIPLHTSITRWRARRSRKDRFTFTFVDNVAAESSGAAERDGNVATRKHYEALLGRELSNRAFFSHTIW